MRPLANLFEHLAGNLHLGWRKGKGVEEFSGRGNSECSNFADILALQ